MQRNENRVRRIEQSAVPEDPGPDRIELVGVERRADGSLAPVGEPVVVIWDHHER